MGLDEINLIIIVIYVMVLFYKLVFSGLKKVEVGVYNVEFLVIKLMQCDINFSILIVEIDFFVNIYKVNGEDVWFE